VNAPRTAGTTRRRCGPVSLGNASAVGGRAA
jgi:hypothetical protein